MIKKRYIVIAMIFMAFIGLQMAEPTTAAKKPKLIDHGKKINGNFTTSWKTYQYKNYILVKQKFYDKGKLIEQFSIKIQRYKKKIILVTITQRGMISLRLPRIIKSVNKQYIYSKSSLSLRRYYLRYVNPRRPSDGQGGNGQ